MRVRIGLTGDGSLDLTMVPRVGLVLGGMEGWNILWCQEGTGVQAS